MSGENTECGMRSECSLELALRSPMTNGECGIMANSLSLQKDAKITKGNRPLQGLQELHGYMRETRDWNEQEITEKTERGFSYRLGISICSNLILSSPRIPRQPLSLA